ncbi:MAG: Hsp33 family molecular chaperone HslO [Lachnospiraceae bacterium]|nr:Hsp33 family molecular chaperone HslO [Lachnospiraceae bacterium]
MHDQIIRATALNATIRIFSASTRNLVEAARIAHGLGPVATAALGRLLSAGAMMGCTLKNKKDLLTLNIRGSGPIGGLTVTADSLARVKGYALNPLVCLPARPDGKIDVGGAVGAGYFQIIKDMGLKEPYAGQVTLQTGEVAEDLTYYFAVSEQTPSIVGLGVLMEKDENSVSGGIVKCAGGFIIQLMPEASLDTISFLEERIVSFPSVTEILSVKADPVYLINKLLGDDAKIAITDTVKPSFYCNCDKERVEKALISIGKDELLQMIKDNETVEVKCHFCNSAYYFTNSDLQRISKIRA